MSERKVVTSSCVLKATRACHAFLNSRRLGCSDPLRAPFPAPPVLWYCSNKRYSKRPPRSFVCEHTLIFMIRIITLALACALGQAALQDATGSCAKWCLAGQQLVVDPDTGRCASTCTACPAGTFKARNGYHGCSVQRTTCDATQRKVFGDSLSAASLAR